MSTKPRTEVVFRARRGAKTAPFRGCLWFAALCTAFTLASQFLSRASAAETPASQPASRPTASAQRGRSLYRERCAVCHGRDGRGDGPAGRAMDPAPRDLTRGHYKLRSTPSGSPPSAEDLFRTLGRGVPGTAMPGWAGLSTEDRWQLVYYLQSLSPRFAKAKPAIPVPAPPPSSPALVARGAVVYATMGCGECHGADGRGDGPAARTLEDDQKHRIYPFDMTRGWKLKSGREPADIYRILLTGLDGTPMPSYQNVLSDEDRWALAHFVRSLFLDEGP